GFPPRPIWEVQQFSADVLSPLTASAASRVWGWLPPHPHAEGELSAGIVTLLLAAVAVTGATRELKVSSAPLREARPGRRLAITIALAPWHARALALALALRGCALYVPAALLVAATKEPNWHIAGIPFRLGDAWKAWVPAVALA